MNLKFLYIDDDAIAKVGGFSNNLEIFTVQHCDSWESQLKFIEKESMLIDGLILDLKLNDVPNANKIRADFRGSTIAQEIRNRQKEKVIKEFPIILYSANDKVLESLEKSGLELFDLFMDKGNMDEKAFDEYSKQLIALGLCYQKHSRIFDIRELLKVEPTFIDPRFVSLFNSLANRPYYITVGFVLNELINKSGLLIDENLLAARLGVDKDKSQSWSALLDCLSSCQYEGILSGGWRRWWMFKIENWWKSISSEHLRTMSASKRVRLISERYKLNDLKESEKIPKAKSDEFWCVCKGYEQPLDPIDGLLIAGQDNLYPWQDYEYVSIDAALQRKRKYEWEDVAEIEKGKLEIYKKVYKKSK